MEKERSGRRGWRVRKGRKMEKKKNEEVGQIMKDIDWPVIVISGLLFLNAYFFVRNLTQWTFYLVFPINF